LNKIFLLVSLLVFSSLQARENPFFAAQGEQDIPISSNQKRTLEPLKRATITLPSTARVIEGVTIKYKTLDGAQHTKSIELENSVDWHLPIFISQSYAQEEKQAPVAKKRVTTQVAKKVVFNKIVSLKFISLFENKNSLKILTKDKMIRHFLLVKPHRIVCDFKRETSLRSHIKKAAKTSKFTKVSFGTHKGYYRVVIELDGSYSYEFKKMATGYLIKLH